MEAAPFEFTRQTGNTATIDVLVMRGKPLYFDLLLGIGAIKALDGVHISQYGNMKFEETQSER